MSAPETTTEKAVVVDLAAGRWLLGVGFGAVVAAVGLYLAIPSKNPLEPVKAGLSALVAAGGVVTCLVWVAARRRLLIGETRVMLVSWRTRKIVGHIPFDDDEGVRFHHGEEDDFFHNPGVSIALRPNRTPATFWPWLLPDDTEVVIKNRFARTPAKLRKMLRTRWQEYARKKEAASRFAGGWSADADVVG